MKTPKSIKWIDAKIATPKLNINDRFDYANGRSVRVLVKVYKNNEFVGFGFAVHIDKLNYQSWSIEGFMGNWEVSHFAYLNQ